MVAELEELEKTNICYSLKYPVQLRTAFSPITNTTIAPLSRTKMINYLT
jgi:hypothetical protein